MISTTRHQCCRVYHLQNGLQLLAHQFWQRLQRHNHYYYDNHGQYLHGSAATFAIPLNVDWKYIAVYYPSCVPVPYLTSLQGYVHQKEVSGIIKWLALVNSCLRRNGKKMHLTIAENEQNVRSSLQSRKYLNQTLFTYNSYLYLAFVLRSQSRLYPSFSLSNAFASSFKLFSLVCGWICLGLWECCKSVSASHSGL